MRTLTSREGTRYQFEPGAFFLDLMLTGGPGRYAEWEVLHRPEDLVSWLEGSPLAVTAPVDAHVRPSELKQVKAFRDGLWSMIPRLAAGGSLEQADIGLLNAAAEPPPRPAIDTDGRRTWAGPVTGRQVMGFAAREAIDVVTSDLASRVRVCAGERCYLVFLDTSRPGNRRWCSMQRCGNLHKVGAYRSRS